MRDQRIWLGIGCLLLALVAACGEEQPRVYTAPRDQPFVPPSFAQETPAPLAPPQPDGDIHWTLPQGWEQQSGSGMRYATILVGPAEHRTELTVIALAPMTTIGDLFDNVNRWRGELAMPPIELEALKQYVVPLAEEPVGVLLVDLAGDAESTEGTLAGIVPRNEKTWFFKLRGPRDVLAAERASLETFLRSIRFDAPTAAPPPQTSALVLPTFQTPEGWETQTQLSTSRHAAFWVTHDSQRAEVTITSFPGDVGSALQNINRWRGQIGLPPVQDVSEQPAETIATDAGDLPMLDIIGAADDMNDRQRILVAIADHGGRKWFFKMQGPVGVVAAHREKFLAFLRSVRFPEPSE